MTCEGHLDRITKICDELAELVERSRTDCDVPECELILCVVYDSVNKMQRVIERWGPRSRAQHDSIETSSAIDINDGVN